MPIYEYRCENGHQFEVIQSMSDDPVTSCEECGASVERVFHPVAVHFKGSGFYTTDYKAKSKAGAAEGNSSNSGDAGSGDSGSGESGSGESKSDSKSESKSESKGSSDSGSGSGDKAKASSSSD